MSSIWKHSVIIFKSNILSHFSNLFVILFPVSSIYYIILFWVIKKKIAILEVSFIYILYVEIIRAYTKL